MFAFIRRRTYRNPPVYVVIQRFLNAVNPDLAKVEAEARGDYRSNRTVPVLLAPFDDEISTDEVCYALTKNLSISGLALVLPQPFRAERVLVGFWFNDEAHFITGEVRQNVPLGGGYWQLGIELTRVISPAESDEVRRLVPMAARLDPRANREMLAAGSRA